MKARTITENINFKRNLDSKSSMSVGLASKAKSKLDDFYGENSHLYLTYDFISIDKIIIKLSDSHIDKRIFRSDANKLHNLPIYIVKYVSIDPYFAAPYDIKGSTWIDENDTYEYSGIWKNILPNTSDPDQMEIRSHIDIKILKSGDKDSEKKSELAVKAFNNEFKPLEGFILIDKILTSAELYKEEVKKISI